MLEVGSGAGIIFMILLKGGMVFYEDRTKTF